jgi:hypothetical protein
MDIWCPPNILFRSFLGVLCSFLGVLCRYQVPSEKESSLRVLQNGEKINSLTIP